MATASLILTLVGPDRPGLVRMLAEEVAIRNGSWLESRMARLAGQFAGIVLVSLPEGEVASLEAVLKGLEEHGLRVLVQTGAAERKPATDVLGEIEVVGHDRPGIVREITQFLWKRGCNIEEITTDVLSGSFSGETMFRAEIRVRMPAHATLEDIRDGLHDLGNELMVDIRHAAAEG